MIKNAWKKLPSVSRPNKFFYYSNNRAILQDWDTSKWYLFENGKPAFEQFDTPKQVMEWAKENVVH
jgi:hypothetical protein